MSKKIIEKNERQRKFKIASLKKPTVHDIVSRTIQGRHRPIKDVKTSQQSIDPKLLIEIPVAGLNTSIEYPVPDWFKKTDKADVSIIIPLYKSNNVIVDLIENWPLYNSLNIEIIFIDDCCPNNSKEVVIKTWNKLQNKPKNKIGRIIYNTENKGYGVSCNIGAEYATGTYLIFLNADTKVTPNWIEPMIRLFDSPEVGIVGNLQLKDGGMWHNTIDSAGSEWNWSDNSFLHIGRHSYNNKHIPVPYKIDQAPKDIISIGEREMVTGCCFAMKNSLFKYIGGFNPNYRVGYWEDSELCMTVKELGYTVMFTPHSVIWHKLSHTNSGNHEYSNYNRNFFINKWITSGRIDKLVKQKRNSSINIGNILINRRGANGDVLVAAGVVPALKKLYPNCKIIFSTDCKEVVQNNPYIDKVINYSEISERMFQVFYNLDMAYEFRPHTPILNVYAETVGVSVNDCKTFISTEPFNIDLPEEYIVIHAGKTSWVGRNWDEKKFADLSQKLMDQGNKVISIGHLGDGIIPCNINLNGKTNMKQMAWIISKAKSFVGIDSFPMHIAQSFNIPGTCFFGCIDPKLRVYSHNMKYVTADNLSCLGCHHLKPVPCTVTNICKQGTEDCINLVEINNMLETINTTL